MTLSCAPPYIVREMFVGTSAARQQDDFGRFVDWLNRQYVIPACNADGVPLDDQGRPLEGEWIERSGADGRIIDWVRTDA